MLQLFLGVLISYLLGSIPFGLLLVKLFKDVDIRDFGSGNIGATNVVRVSGKLLGGLTLALDVLKALVGLWICRHILAFEQDALLMCGFFAVLGHMFSVWLRFRGGKGVATTVAVMVYLMPLLGSAAIAVWLFVFWLRKISGLAALCMMLIVSSMGLVMADLHSQIFLLSTTILIFIKHASNIKAMLRGEYI